MDPILNNDTLLARWLSNELTAAEQQALEQHPDYPAFRQVVEAADRLRLPDPEVPQMWQRLQPKLAAATKNPPPTARRVALRWWVATAAAAAVALLLWVAPWASGDSAPLAVSTGVGEQKTVTLPDGSRVRLNAQSSVEIAGGNWQQKRRIQLNGEAFFEVHKNPDAPFVVESANGQVEVLGTTFTVRARPGKFDVRCYTGVVRGTSKDTYQITLRAGESAEARYGTQDWTPLPATRDTLPPWTSGTSRFADAPLSEVVEMLEIQYGVTVKTDGLDNRRFTGALPHNNLDLALQIVSKALELQYRVTGKNVTFSAK